MKLSPSFKLWIELFMLYWSTLPALPLSHWQLAFGHSIQCRVFYHKLAVKAIKISFLYSHFLLCKWSTRLPGSWSKPLEKPEHLLLSLKACFLFQFLSIHYLPWCDSKWSCAWQSDKETSGAFSSQCFWVKNTQYGCQKVVLHNLSVEKEKWQPLYIKKSEIVFILWPASHVADPCWICL